MALCFLIAAVICLLVGCVNGIVVARFQILSFITTLGMGTVLDGVIYGLTGGTTVFNGIPKAFTIPGILKIAGYSLYYFGGSCFITWHFMFSWDITAPGPEAVCHRRQQGSG